ncbi:putative lipid II flippase FtsW [Capillimicrobium parvum]|uniref:Probable peptidoglycan glycosyltransferase FtsW n=1 Tax=Capillimicrobium parvum TaxID=2884022 RepID=A0A9E6XWL4_9ACTN|nr:putative lipid II flippase FtsW [Capillimicrobium parvum]UGS35748.1 putative peptidoglycan glycosyltransferase FtsW [Capillimicrobium parvum]
MARTRAAAREQPVEHRILLTATLCLLAAGAVMVYSASSARTLLEGQGDGTAYLVKYVMWGVVGIVIMQVVARMDLRRVRDLTPMLVGVSVVMLLAVKVPGVGVQVNGATRWLGAGPLQFQPSELAKIALVLYAVRLISEKPKLVLTLKGIFRPLGMVVGACALLIVSQPDLGTFLVIAFTLTAVLVAAGMPLKLLGKCLLVGVLLIGLFALLEPYRRDRLTAFIDPWAHADTIGYQSAQGQIALGSGGFLGRGLGESVQKIFFLPEAHTDFILAVIGEELGVVGVWALLFLYGLIAYAGLRAAKAAKGAYASLLAVGVTSLILCQALLNLFTVLGMAPLTGVPLPFISSGSSSLIVLLAGMGLLLNVSSGRTAHLMPVRSGSRDDEGADRRRGNGRPRGARAGGRRRAAG